MKPLKKILLLCWLLAGGMGEGHAQLWEPLGQGLDIPPVCIYGDSVGDRLYACGAFSMAGGAPACQIAGWDGTQWSPMFPEPGDTTCPYYYGLVTGLQRYGNSLIVAGNFYGLDTANIFRHLFRVNEFSVIDTLWLDRFNGWLETTNGQLFGLGGWYGNDSQPLTKIKVLSASGDWQQFGDTTLRSDIAGAMKTSAYYHGQYIFAGNIIAPPSVKEIGAWAEDHWEALGPGVLGDAWVNKLCVYRDQLFVAGEFRTSSGNPADYLMAWDGQQWYNPFPSVFFSSQAFDLLVHHDTLFITGLHAVWTGAGWSEVHSQAYYDGSNFCSFGGSEIYTQRIGVYRDELYFTSLNTNIPSPYQGLAHWIGGDSVDNCIYQPVRVTDPFSSIPAVTLQPNPTRDYFRLTAPAALGPATLALHDLQGRALLPARSYSGEEIDVGGLPAGLYLVEVRSRGGRQVLKLVRE